MPAKTCWVYIMANPWSHVLYTGVTSDIVRRVWQHKQQTTGFTAQYKVTRLVYLEEHDGPTSAITREK
jgi:putative endonuclease